MDELVERTVSHRLTANAGIKVGGRQDVILVGGSRGCPRSSTRFAEFFGKGAPEGRQPGRGGRQISAAIQGGVLKGRRQGRCCCSTSPVVARHRNAGRGDDQADPEEHDHPDKAQPMFPTDDNQTAVTIHALQGEARSRRRQQELSQFNLDQASPGRAARHAADRRVMFDIDANGILHVTARTRRPAKRSRSGGLGLTGNGSTSAAPMPAIRLTPLELVEVAMTEWRRSMPTRNKRSAIMDVESWNPDLKERSALKRTP